MVDVPAAKAEIDSDEPANTKLHQIDVAREAVSIRAV
jgi:hypothetical protein